MKFSSFISLLALPAASGYAFVSSSTRSNTFGSSSTAASKRSSSNTLKMVDQQVLMGAGIAVAGTIAGIGLVAFTENQGERAKARGGGLSDSMATSIAGTLMEDVEVSSVSDLGGLTSQLENALKQSGGVDDNKMQELELTEEEKKKIAEDLDDGW